MKKILFSAVSALALASFAADSTQFGALQVLSTAKRTLVAIPWCEASTAGTAVAVSNLVLTANLTANDTIDVLKSDGKTLERWKLEEDDRGVKYWQAPTNVGEGDSVTAGTSADKATVDMGASVSLIRQKAVYAAGDDIPDDKEAGDAIPFYVMGQVAATAPTTTIAAPGGTHSITNVCYNMIAPPSTVAQCLNGGDHGATWSSDKIDPDDRIYIPTSELNIELAYTNDNWCQYKTITTTNYYLYVYSETTKRYEKDRTVEPSYVPQKGEKVRTSKATCDSWVTYTDTIPVGTGFWYVSAGGTPTVTWKDVPTK